MADDSDVSRRTRRLTAVQQRTIQDIPKEEGLFGDERRNATPQQEPPMEERVRGGPNLGD